MGMFEHFFLCSTAPYITMTIKEYPVFKPNEYFWKNHYDPSSGKQRWEVYASVIRGIIQSSFNFKLSDMSLEEKIKYKRLLRETKITKKD